MQMASEHLRIPRSRFEPSSFASPSPALPLFRLETVRRNGVAISQRSFTDQGRSLALPSERGLRPKVSRRDTAPGETGATPGATPMTRATKARRRTRPEPHPRDIEAAMAGVSEFGHAPFHTGFEFAPMTERKMIAVTCAKCPTRSSQPWN